LIVFFLLVSCFAFFMVIYNIISVLVLPFILYIESIFFALPLQDFTVLPTDIFCRCVIRSSSVIFLPTSSSMDYVRRLSLHRWFPIPSLYRSEKQKNHLPMVLHTEFARQKKVSRLKYTDRFSFRQWYRDLPTATFHRYNCRWVYDIPTKYIRL